MELEKVLEMRDKLGYVSYIFSEKRGSDIFQCDCCRNRAWSKEYYFLSKIVLKEKTKRLLLKVCEECKNGMVELYG